MTKRKDPRRFKIHVYFICDLIFVNYMSEYDVITFAFQFGAQLQAAAASPKGKEKPKKVEPVKIVCYLLILLFYSMFQTTFIRK